MRLNVGRCSHFLECAFLFSETWQVTLNTFGLKLQHNLSCHCSGQRPGVSSRFSGGPGAIWFLPPRFVFMLVVAQLSEAVVGLDVVNEFGALPKSAAM